MLLGSLYISFTGFIHSAYANTNMGPIYYLSCIEDEVRSCWLKQLNIVFEFEIKCFKCTQNTVPPHIHPCQGATTSALLSRSGMEKSSAYTIVLPHHSDSLVPSCAQHEMIETIHAPLYTGDLHRKDAAGQDPKKAEHCCTVMKSVGNECKSYATSTLLLQGKWEGSLASLVSYTLKLGEGLAH